MVYSLDKTIQDYIQQYAVSVLSPTITTVIWEKPNTPGNQGLRPSKPYASLSVLTPPVPESAQADMVKLTDGSFQHHMRYLFTVSLNIYSESDDYMKLIKRFSDQMRFVATTEYFQPKKLAFYNIGSFTDLSELISTGWEYRAHADLFFRWTDLVTEEVGIINKTRIVGTGTAETDEDITITIDTR